MTKKYYPDILCIICIILIMVIALLAAEKPVIDLSMHPSVAHRKPPGDIKKEEPKAVERGIVKKVTSWEKLKERNIFAADGKYPVSIAGVTGTQKILPEKPYTLIGVLQGEEKKAVFRDPTGAIVTFTVGKKLMDDSVITRINTFSVELEKGKERRELRIFEFKPPQPLTQKKP
ncbi:MAG: hypothetical protein FJ130_00030 [Deltaproteobacteria bacterium]|nr:hypothetical protein [Deltaproteobacteria bacterium]